MATPFSNPASQKYKEQPFALLHIPHSSTHIPSDLRETLLLSDETLADELLLMTDAYTDEIFRCDPNIAIPIVSPVSRLIVDPERFLNDAEEPMSKVGMGVIYMKTSDGRALRNPPSEAERINLIRRFYEPHHALVEKAVRASLERWGACLIIDCHSFPSDPLPSDQDQRRPRPDICIGTDPFHTPPWLTRAAIGIFKALGFQVFVNRPYIGTIIPMHYYKCESSVWSVMIEVNRALYMDERTGERLKVFGMVCDQITIVIRSTIIETRRGNFPTGLCDTAAKMPF